MSTIHLRNLESSDKSDVFDLVQNPNVMKYLGPKRALNNSEALAWFEAELEKPSRFVVAHSQTDELIGFCGVKSENGIFDFGYFLREKFWGKGEATKSCKLVLEAISCELDLSKLEIFIANENTGSQRVAEKLGWTKLNGYTKDNEDGYLYSVM